MEEGEIPSFVAKDEEGQTLFELPLGWDPLSRSTENPAGDFDRVLEALDDSLGMDETTDALGAKVLTLIQLGAPEERIAEVGRRLLELTDDPGEELPHEMALSRLLIGDMLRATGQLREAEQAFADVAAFYGPDSDPFMRAVAAFALRERVNVLADLSEFDAVQSAWASARAEYGAETLPSIREAVAATGRRAAHALGEAERWNDAGATAEEVISLYRADTEAEIRAQVAAAMMLRLTALPRRKYRARREALRELLHFAGDEPEPQVLQALTATNRRSAAIVRRLAHDERHHHRSTKPDSLG